MKVVFIFNGSSHTCHACPVTTGNWKSATLPGKMCWNEPISIHLLIVHLVMFCSMPGMRDKHRLRSPARSLHPNHRSISQEAFQAQKEGSREPDSPVSPTLRCAPEDASVNKSDKGTRFFQTKPNMILGGSSLISEWYSPASATWGPN